MKNKMELPFAGRSPRRQGRRSELIALFMLMTSERSGYDIRKLLEEWHIKDYLPVSPAAIYRTLERLENEGFVQSYREQRGNYPVSTVYRITDSGREAYCERVLREGSFHRTPFAVMTFLSLGSFLPRQERIALTDAWIGSATELVNYLRKRVNCHEGEDTIYGKPFAEWLVLDHEASMMECEIAWMKKYRTLLERGEA